MKKFVITLLLTAIITPLISAASLPIVRENAKWVYHHLLVNDGIKEDHRYELFFKGDSIVDGITYKKCFVKYDVPVHSGSFVEQGKVPMALARDNNSKVYVRFTEDVIAESKAVSADCKFSYYVPGDTEEKLIYDYGQGKFYDYILYAGGYYYKYTVKDADGKVMRFLIDNMGEDNGYYELHEQFHGDLVRCHIPTNYNEAIFDELRFDYHETEVKHRYGDYIQKIESNDYVNALGHHDINTFQPLVREDRIWVNKYDYYGFSPEDTDDEDLWSTSYMYMYRFEGDTLVNGVKYKRCLTKVNDEKMAARKNPTCGGGHVRATVSTKQKAQPLGWYECALVRAKDMRVYKFVEETEEFGTNTEEQIANYAALRLDTRDKYISQNTINIDGVPCNQYKRIDWGGRSEFDATNNIESIGPATGVGDILFPYEGISTCELYSVSGLSHVLNKDGEIIYKTPTYDPNSWSKVSDIQVVKPVNNNRYYNLQGQQVDIKSAPAGIYIHNGKKVVVK